jgi:hypothetical protein
MVALALDEVEAVDMKEDWAVLFEVVLQAWVVM